MNRSLCWIFSALLALASARAQSFKITELPPLPGHNRSEAFAINATGQTAGDSYGDDFRSRATVWTGVTPQNIHTLVDARESVAFGINSQGQAAGDLDLRGSLSQVFFWSDGAMQVVLGGPYDRLREGYAINDSGTVVGVGGTTDGFAWRAGVLTLLPFLPGDYSARPEAINAAGIIAGTSFGSNGTRAVRWINNVPQVLSGVESAGSRAHAISATGHVAGETGGFFNRRAFLWHPSIGVIMLPLPSGAATSVAYGVNSGGDVVGEVDGRAVLWKNDAAGYKTFFVEDGLAPDTNWTGLDLYGINDTGVIVGTGRRGAYERGFTAELKPQPLIRVDLDRNLAIDFGTEDDQTSTTRRFVFWLNNDRDLFDAKQKEQDDLNPTGGPPDYQHTKIACARDLEDFVRVHVQAPDKFDAASPDWQVKLAITDVVEGNPTVNVTPALQGDLGYLTDPSVALNQVAQATITPVLDATGIDLARSQFVTVGQSKFTYLLFEARTAGRGALTVRFYKAGQLVADDKVHLELRPMNELYDHWTVGDTDAETLQADTIPVVAQQIGTRIPAVDVPNTYFLFVHGWRMQPWERRAFAETAYKRLWHLGYRGGFGLYSWPTEWHESGVQLATDMRNYDRSERKSWRSAPGLRALLVQLNGRANRFSVLAHSMGNIVVSEALLLEVQEHAPTPQQLVRLYLPSQAASVANAYDAAVEIINKDKVPDVYSVYPITGRPYFTGFGSAAGAVVNLFNQRDYALTSSLSWPFNQSSKPDKGFDYKKGEYFAKGTNGNKVIYQFPMDRAVIYAHIAPAYSRALGAEPVIAGLGAVDLGVAPFNFTGDSRDHSAQFRSDLPRRRAYWQMVLDRL